MNQAMQVLTSSETNEWYTPEDPYIEMAREVMGDIDLDPASCAAAQAGIQAGTYYTIDDNGLSKPWFGRVWLNPPYGKTGNRSNQDIWTSRLWSDYRVFNRVVEGIALIKSVPGYEWYEKARDLADAFCEARERIRFINAVTGKRGQAKAGSTFLYYGPDAKRFKGIYGEIGRVTIK